MEPVTVTPGSSPLILAMPHTGTHVPPEIWDKFNERGRLLADTDWHLDQLYDGLAPDVTIVRANFHRYVIDANRAPDGASLYPGQNTTGLCPTTDFDGCAILLDGHEPSAAEIERRRRAFHEPYHAALLGELERIKTAHGIVVLYDCHSIRSEISFLFDGVLPDLNIGTNYGVTCAPEMERQVHAICKAEPAYRTVLNGRFRGGWTTRHYGQPELGIHAIQMELAQSTHLESQSPPFAYHDGKATGLRSILQPVLQTLVAQARALSPKA